jgi:hypothetical protein
VSIFNVAVSLSSDSRSLADLTELAGAEPTRSHSRGDRRSPRLPATSVFADNYWTRDSEIKLDTWTLGPHWPMIAPILESLASGDLEDVRARLSIGTNARGTGYAFDLKPHQIALLSRAGCGLWIDTYEANLDANDLPDDYPYPVDGTLHPSGRWRRLRRRLNVTIRDANPFGKVRRHARKLPPEVADGPSRDG